MKKILAAALALCLLLALGACGNSDRPAPADSSDEQDAFVTPAGCVTVLQITINPQFRLYLDADDKVLAVEPLNADARSVVKDVDTASGDRDAVIRSILTAAKNGGFVKNGSTVNLQVMETEKAEGADQALLKAAEMVVAQAAVDLNVTLTVKKLATPSTTSTTVTTTAAENTTTAGTTTGTTAAGTAATTTAHPIATKTVPATTAHKHAFAAADCTKPKTCACGATEGAPLGHEYDKDGVCIRCGGKVTPIAQKNGVWQLRFLAKNEQGKDELRDCKLTLTGSQPLIAVGIGEAVDTLDDSIKENPNFANDCVEFEGKQYYIGAGDGGPLTVKFDGSAMIVTDDVNGKITLKRTGEDTLTVTAVDAKGSWYFGGVKTGTTLTFTTDNT